MTRRWVWIAAAALGGGAACSWYFSRDPLAFLYKLHVDRVERTAFPYPDGRGAEIRTFFFSGDTSAQALDLLNKNLKGAPWRETSAGSDYAYFTNTKPVKKPDFGYWRQGLGVTQGRMSWYITENPGSSDVQWLQTDNGRVHGIVHEYVQISKLHTWVLRLFHRLSDGPEPDKYTPAKPTPGLNATDDLFEAIDENDLNGVTSALSAGATLHNTLIPMYGAHGSPLTEALTDDHLEIAQLLLDRGADINEGLMVGDALDYAVGSGDLAAVNFVFQHGYRLPNGGGQDALCSVSGVGSPTDYALFETSSAGSNAVVPVPPGKRAQAVQEYEMFDQGVDAGRSNPVWADGAPNYNANRWESAAPIAEVLLSHGVHPNGTGTYPAGRTALHNAAASGNAGLVRVLLAHGADMSLKDYSGKTARQIALGAKRNQWREVVALLDAAAAKRN